VVTAEVDAVAVVVVATVAAVDNTSFQMKNVIDNREKPLYELKGLFFMRIDIRDKLLYIG
jgi:hypothetical protein